MRAEMSVIDDLRTYITSGPAAESPRIEMDVVDGSTDNEEGRPAEAGTPVPLPQVSSHASDAKEESSDTHVGLATSRLDISASPSYLIAEADDAIDEIVPAGVRVGLALAHERSLIDGYATAKDAAVRRIMEEKGIAATPAEKFVNTDAEFAGYRDASRASVLDRMTAEAQYESVKLRAKLAVHIVEIKR